jgi:hypothetical protein
VTLRKKLAFIFYSSSQKTDTTFSLYQLKGFSYIKTALFKVNKIKVNKILLPNPYFQQDSVCFAGDTRYTKNAARFACDTLY